MEHQLHPHQSREVSGKPLHFQLQSGNMIVPERESLCTGPRRRKRSLGSKSKNISIKCTVLSTVRLVFVASTLIFFTITILQFSLYQKTPSPDSSSLRISHHRLQEDEWHAPASQRTSTTNTARTEFSFDAHSFQSTLDVFRKQSNYNQGLEGNSISVANNVDNSAMATSSNLRRATPTSRLLTANTDREATNSTVTESNSHPTLHVPFWDKQILFRKQSSWHLMVVVLADDCLPHYDDGKPPTKGFPSLATLKDALQTRHADVVFYLPQVPQSTMFPSDTQVARQQQVQCQQTLLQTLRANPQFKSALDDTGQLQIVEGVVNPLPPRIKYDYNHGYPLSYQQLAEMKLTPPQLQMADAKLKYRLKRRQLQIELDYSLGLEFAYAAELAYQYADLLFFVRAGTRLKDDYYQTTLYDKYKDYGYRMVQHYEHFQQRLDKDLLIHRFCYQSFLQNDMMYELPPVNMTEAERLRKFQPNLQLPTGILMERHGLYRMSLALRSLMPYHQVTTAGLLETYCNDLLWEAQILTPMSDRTPNVTNDEVSMHPPAMFQVPPKDNDVGGQVYVDAEKAMKPFEEEQVQGKHQLGDGSNPALPHPSSVPAWVTVDNTQLGPQGKSSVNSSHLIQMPRTASVAAQQQDQPERMVTFVVPTSTRPNGIKNTYVTYSLNQLVPLLKRDFYDPITKQYTALILLVICGNTQEELDDHQAGLWEYYLPEIKQGIIEIVSTNLETYPSLYNLPNNYNDAEMRLRWRSKQNLDISSSFFAAKGRSRYTMLLEDDTGYRDKFTTTLKMMLQSDMRHEAAEKVAVKSYLDDYKQHTFSQIHFGFGYSGVLIHDDDVLVYAVLHYIFMDEKPCDLMYLANHMQGSVLDQKWRWQLKRVLITHLGSVSSLKGKIQPVWGVRG